MFKNVVCYPKSLSNRLRAQWTIAVEAFLRVRRGHIVVVLSITNPKKGKCYKNNIYSFFSASKESKRTLSNHLHEGRKQLALLIQPQKYERPKSSRSNFNLCHVLTMEWKEKMKEEYTHYLILQWQCLLLYQNNQTNPKDNIFGVKFCNVQEKISFMLQK